ncbi:ATPase, T2SS/T4P/T4SS family [Zhaonella formicivorans]|uniref:ATPase, T2SS/T4P/T4SS family n=1 Tax=Zhaonella formicivorans TaxID=2528593 RepID=UPI0010EE2444|nr:ATPase, T2SS/T4P/T4SS family [Zhaonella formicivorans]
MLVNPYNIGLINPTKQISQVKQPFEKMTDEIIEELLLKKLDLISGVQQGKFTISSVKTEIRGLVAEKNLRPENLDEFVESVVNNLFGYDLLQPYIEDPDVSDILGNNHNTFYIKKFGVKIRIPVDFGSEQNYLKFLYKVAAICGDKIDENMNAEAVFSDKKRNMRIVISLKPVSAKAPTIAIRKHTRTYSLCELAEMGMLDREQKDLLHEAVLKRKNIIIAGKGGSGKSTLLGALIALVPYTERGLLIQETFEIEPEHPDVVCKLVRLSDNPFVKDYTLFDLTKIGLLMSMDRIFIGELKDREAFDFFNAVFTGHEGSMATVHAPSAGQVIERLLQLMARANTNVAYEELKKMLAETLDIVVFMKDFKIKEVFNLKQQRKGNGEVC